MSKVILHLDMNSYFATVEQQSNPFLRGKPVGVVKAWGRSCIIAASVEAKKYGVATGSTVWEALRLCPGIVLVPADMEKYLAVTKKIIFQVARISPKYEIFSIDEVFMDITEVSDVFTGGAVGMAMAIKERIKERVGDWLTCSVGISHNKVLAKLASGLMKPDGMFVIDSGNLDLVLKKVSLTDVCGIGPRISRRLRGLGVSDLLSIRKLPESVLVEEFGRHGAEFLISVSRGEGDDCVRVTQDIPEQKGVSRTYTLFSDTWDLEKIKGVLRCLCEEAGWKLRQMGMRTKSLGMAVRGGGKSGFARVTVTHGIDDGWEIYGLILELFKKTHGCGAVRFLGIWATNLYRRGDLSLLPETRKRQEVNQALDLIRAKHGYFSMYPARLLWKEKVRPEINGFLGDKYFLFKKRGGVT